MHFHRLEKKKKQKAMLSLLSTVGFGAVVWLLSVIRYWGAVGDFVSLPAWMRLHPGYWVQRDQGESVRHPRWQGLAGCSRHLPPEP